MTEFQTDRSAAVAHAALKSAVQTMENSQKNAVLWFGEILQRKLYRDLGYSSINQYAQMGLGFSPSRTGDFLQLCRKLEKLPVVKDQVARGKLGYTKAREVVKVADESNQQQWLEVAQTRSRRELEREVKKAKQEAADRAAGQGSLLPLEKSPAAIVPVRVAMEMSPTQFARYESLWEKLRKKGAAPADKVEALLEALACYVAETSPRGVLGDTELVAKQHDKSQDTTPERNSAASNGADQTPVQIHIHQCPDCAKASVLTSRGELEIGIEDLERAQCDARVGRPGQSNTSTIPPKTRRQVLSRDRQRCRRPGCANTRFLEVHHIVPRSAGGSNAAENLITLCGACHRLHHHLKLGTEKFWPRAPDQKFQDRLVEAKVPV